MHWRGADYIALQSRCHNCSPALAHPLTKFLCMHSSQSESNFAKAARESLGISDYPTAAPHTSKPEDDDGPQLFDLVFEKPEKEVQIRTHRDTKNPTRTTKARNMGQALTTMTLAFGAPDDQSKPEHARKPIVRDTFYRPVKILYPGGCSADPQD